MSAEKLGGFLREVSNWTWEEFVRAEADKSFTSNQAIIFGLIRNCANQKLNGIQMALNRLDGKLATPVKVEYPSIYYLYPNAKITDEAAPTPITGADFSTGVDHTAITTMEDGVITDITIIEPEDHTHTEREDRDLATMSLRETLTEMAEYPRELPEGIIRLAQQTEEWLRGAGPPPDEIPKVKSVVAAALLTLAQARNMNAITEVFDQIDGKLVETIKVLGEDIFINNYAPIAPPGAKKNSDGVYQLEAVEAQRTWARKLGKADV